MGDWAESALRYFWNRQGSSRKRRPSFQKGSGDFMWRTKEGKVLPMRDMTDEHLANALRMCERNGNTGKAEQLRAVLKERE